MASGPTSRRVVIAGGGVAGLEALLAVHDLAGERAELTLIAPEPEFVYKPLLVEEPFNLGPAERHELAPLVAELGARLVPRSVERVETEAGEVTLDDGTTLGYDHLIICIGARFRPAFEGVRTFPSSPEPLAINELLEGAPGERRIAFVVPPGVTWALPIYELALMTQRRARELRREVRLTIVTPEQAPLAIFGPIASDAVAELLATRGIGFEGGTSVRERAGAHLLASPGERRIEAAEVVSLPAVEGPAIPGLPVDQRGFIPIDEHARVRGLDRVYAAGDATNFPVKQGGLGTQQADAAAAHLAHRLGSAVEAEPFRPVLRGKLLTGEESLHLRAEVAGGGGEAVVALDYLWWPPHKIGARYLAPFLHHSELHEEPEPPRRPLEVEVELPKEWHSEPMALDPYRFEGIG